MLHRSLMVMLLVGLSTLVCAAHARAAGGITSDHPNIVFILADDLDVEYPSNTWNKYPLLHNVMNKQGATFLNSFVNVSLCCPSRLSILRGQYAHNTGMFDNETPHGGFAMAYERGLEASTIATWLKTSGYRTILLGKYLNGYPSNPPGDTYVPPGWTDWFAGSADNYSQFNYFVNGNGHIVHYGLTPNDYLQDVMRKKAVAFIADNAAKPDRPPFFMYLASYSPHQPAAYAPRHASRFAAAIAPRVPTFNQADLSGLPFWMQSVPPLKAADIAAIDTLYRNRLRSMCALVETVDAVISKLAQTGDLENTYIFFTSDNGFHLGQHRFKPGKNQFFEEDVRVPLIVRGPGVPAGVTREQMTLNIDFAPTFAELAGIPVPASVDGRSLVPLLRAAPPPRGAWRQAFLMERGWFGRPNAPTIKMARETPQSSLEPPDQDAAEPAAANTSPAFDGLHTQRYVYLEYYNARAPELYDLQNDPYQSSEVANSASPGLLVAFSAWLDTLRHCKGQGCRTAEDHPPY